MPAKSYFAALFRDALVLADSLPLGRDFPNMSVVSGTIQPAVQAYDRGSVFAPPPIEALRGAFAAAHSGPTRSAGLNTTGMLLDRLTILAMKHWATRRRADAPEKAAELERTQVAELLQALSEARPGSSSVNNKMTSHSVSTTAPDFSSAVFGLFTTNLLLWEAQEVLYHHDLATAPAEELRAYIGFFSEGNLQRNAYIQACDVHWWALVNAAGESTPS